jgi:hypothetical protein
MVVVEEEGVSVRMGGNAIEGAIRVQADAAAGMAKK